MRLLLSTVVILSASCVSSSSSLPAFSRSITGHSLFGITRGGGLFGGKDEKKYVTLLLASRGNCKHSKILTILDGTHFIERMKKLPLPKENDKSIPP